MPNVSLGRWQLLTKTIMSTQKETKTLLQFTHIMTGRRSSARLIIRKEVLRYQSKKELLAQIKKRITL